MSAVNLYRVDLTRNMSRYYRLGVIGAWCFIREWKRIRRLGPRQETVFASPEEAAAASMKQRSLKKNKGYLPTLCVGMR